MFTSQPSLPPTALLTQWEIMQIKKEEQRAKTRNRMAKYRERLKDMSPEEQQEARERARIARARYRDNHRAELCAHARAVRASKFAAKYGIEALEARLERKRQKLLDQQDIPRRTVRPRAGRSPKKASSPHSQVSAA